MEVFDGDRMAHARQAHMFVVPSLMTHLRRKYFGKDADVLMTITTGDHFWDKSQHKLLILAIILPFAHVENYRGRWIARGLEKTKSLWKELEAGFKITVGRNPKEFPRIDRKLCGMWKDPDVRSRAILLQCLDWARGFPPVWGCLVQEVLPRVPVRLVSKVTGSGSVA